MSATDGIEELEPDYEPEVPSLHKTSPSNRTSRGNALRPQLKRSISQGLAAKDIRSRSSSYAVLKRDILYSTINEYRLPGHRLNRYAELLDLLNIDLYPFFADGQTWYHCQGRQEDHSKCKRMVPEIYFRTTLGMLLRVAGELDLQGDELVEELANALSYAICSKHRDIHKILRAHEASHVLQEWRQKYGSSDSAIDTGPRARHPKSSEHGPETERGENSPASSSNIVRTAEESGNVRSLFREVQWSSARSDDEQCAHRKIGGDNEASSTASSGSSRTSKQLQEGLIQVAWNGQ